MYVLTAGVQKGEKRDAAVRVWDLSTGVVVSAYRGGIVARRGLAACSAGVLLAAQYNKPAVHAWQLRAEPLHLKIGLKETCTSLALTPDGTLCAVGTPSGRLCVWDVASGDLLSVVQSAHYRAVTTIKFNDDGGHLVSASEDGMVKVWKTRALADTRHREGTAGETAPTYTWAEHTLPVTDVHCGFGGLGARVFTVSKDCSCKVLDLGTGELVGSLAFPTDLHSVTADPAEQYVFAGGGNGTLYAVALFGLDLSPAAPTLLRNKDLLGFVGHTQAVTMVAVTVDGSILLSGSDDGDVRVWDAESRQCVKVFGHKEPVTSMQLVPKHWIDHTEERVSAPVSVFSRQPTATGTLDFTSGVPLRLRGAVLPRTAAATAVSARHNQGDAQLRDEHARLAAEVQLWKTAAGALYEYTQKATGL